MEKQKNTDNWTPAQWRGRRNKRNGSDRERRIVNSFKARGGYAVRSAGSHGEIDVVGIDMEKKEIKLIQSKPSSMSEKEKEAIRVAGNRFNGYYEVRFEVW